MHGGTISAHSEGAGRGSRFVVRLPALRAPDTAPDTERMRRVYSNAICRVLVVDDVPDSIATLAALLRHDGNEVDTAADGIQALAKAREFAPNVILLDLGLPGMSGYEVCRAIREQPWGNSIYIVAVTGWGQAEDRVRTRAAGFNAHLVKPIDYDAVRAIIAAPSLT
jgi:CheY-like chemotaxis protein